MANEDSIQEIQIATLVFNYLKEEVAAREKSVVDRLIGHYHGGDLTENKMLAGIAEIAAVRSMRDKAYRKATAKVEEK
jgi:hypothetical protein